jgi:hypothetical protein
MADLFDFLSSEGYFEIRQIPGRGYCGLHRMLFTVGIFYGMDAIGYKGRYCYPDLRSAIDGIREWDGIEDPPGPWIKHKEDMEFENPNPNPNLPKVASAKTA